MGLANTVLPYGEVDNVVDSNAQETTGGIGNREHVRKKNGCTRFTEK